MGQVCGLEGRRLACWLAGRGLAEEGWLADLVRLQASNSIVARFSGDIIIRQILLSIFGIALLALANLFLPRRNRGKNIINRWILFSIFGAAPLTLAVPFSPHRNRGKNIVNRRIIFSIFGFAFLTLVFLPSPCYKIEKNHHQDINSSFDFQHHTLYLTLLIAYPTPFLC